MKIEEEQSADTEIEHIAEDIAYLALDAQEMSSRFLVFDETLEEPGYVICKEFTNFPSDAISTAFWVKTKPVGSVAGSQTFLSYASIGDRSDWRIMHTSLGLHISRGAISVTATGISIDDMQWHHIVVTWQEADGTLCVYVDGEIGFMTEIPSGIVAPMVSGGALVLCYTNSCG